MRILRETLYKDSFDTQFLYKKYSNWNSELHNY